MREGLRSLNSFLLDKNLDFENSWNDSTNVLVRRRRKKKGWKRVANETKELCKCTIHAHFCATGGHQLQEAIELKDPFETASRFRYLTNR